MTTDSRYSLRTPRRYPLERFGNSLKTRHLFFREPLEQAQTRFVRAANAEMILAYWEIGREIVEHLQAGDERAGYGKKLIDELSERLCARFGRGYSSTNLRYFRTFFTVYSTRTPTIRHIRGDGINR